MHVVQICPYAWNRPGGVQAHVRGLAAELTRRGHRVDVLAPADASIDNPEVTVVGRPISVRYNGSVAPICPRPAALARVARLVRRLRPDLVHVHEPFSPGLAMAGALASAAPVVATFHASADRLWTYRTFAPLLGIVGRRLHRAIAVSPAAAALLAGDLGLNVEVAPNGIGDDRFLPAVPLALPPAPTVLFVGRLEPRKGLRVLLDALPALVARVPHVRLLIAGDGRERNALAALPPALARHVMHLGAVSDDELRRCYASADVFVAPALARESFGVVLLEAMAAGVPIVASDIPGYRAVVRDSVDGLLVPPQDPRSLCAALASVLTDRTRAAALSSHARTRARDFSWTRTTDAILSIYDDALRLHRVARVPVAPAAVHTAQRG